MDSQNLEFTIINLFIKLLDENTNQTKDVFVLDYQNRLYSLEYMDDELAFFSRTNPDFTKKLIAISPEEYLVADWFSVTEATWHKQGLNKILKQIEKIKSK